MSDVCLVHKLIKNYRKCGRQDIEVYIIKDGRKLPICHGHWSKIAEKQW